MPAATAMGATQELARLLVVLASNIPMGVTGFGDAIIMHIVLTLCSLVRTLVVGTPRMHRSTHQTEPLTDPPPHRKLHTQLPSSQKQTNQNFPGVCRSAVSEAVFNLTIGGLAAMAVQSALIWRDTNWKVPFASVRPSMLVSGIHVFPKVDDAIDSYIISLIRPIVHPPIHPHAQSWCACCSRPSWWGRRWA